MATPYLPARRRWSAKVLLAGVCYADVTCTRDEAQAYDQRLWTDLAAEYDARLLRAEILGRGTQFTPEFHAFLDLWTADEAHHTDGLLRVYSLVMDETESDVLARLAGRRGDFDRMGAWLDDEFELTVLLAYDEAMSTRGYAEDIPFYAALGPPAFGALLRELKNDEAVHYSNAIDLLVDRHSERVDDVPAVIERIVAFDAAQDEYRATFVLDHASDQFTSALMAHVGDVVGRTLQRRMRRAR